MTPSEIGERAEIAIAAALTQAGKHIVIPFGPRRYDLAFEQDGRLVKVQCKSGREYNGVIVFRTSSEIHGTYRHYREDIHLFGVYCHSRREIYLVPVDHVPSHLAHLRLVPPRNNQKAGIRMAAQYLARDGRLPDAVDRALEVLSSRDSTPNSSPAGRPSRSSSLDRQMSMFGCRVQSTNIDSGGTMPIPLQLAPEQTPVACCSPLAAPELDDPATQATAALFKALGDPHRVRVVNLLSNAGEPVCVCDITQALGLSQSTVSFHLKKLTNAGLLRREQRGTWAYYSMDPQAMSTLRSVVSIKGRTA